jgi:hypothetical protein
MNVPAETSDCIGLCRSVWTTEFVVGFAESLVVFQNATLTVPPLWFRCSGRVEVFLPIGITTKCSWIACDELYDQTCTLLFSLFFGVKLDCICLVSIYFNDTFFSFLFSLIVLCYHQLRYFAITTCLSFTMSRLLWYSLHAPTRGWLHDYYLAGMRKHVVPVILARTYDRAHLGSLILHIMSESS